MDKNLLISVFNDTMDCCIEQAYTAPSGRKVDIEGTGDMQKNTIFYTKLAPVTQSKGYDTEVEVANIDCLKAAESLVKEKGYERVCVLNMASFIRPGGGVTKGSKAQEEDLCRRTNLFMSIGQYHELGLPYGINIDKEHSYPLPAMFGAIYSPGVTVFREGSKDLYRYMEEPFKADVISIAALRKPRLDFNNEYADNEAYGRMEVKIRQMFLAPAANGCEVLVLGAFGCGAYQNPPKVVANIFKDVLETEPYSGLYKKIVFAVLDDGNSHREHNPDGNFKPFHDILV